MLPAIAAGVSIASSIAGIAGGLSSNKKAREATREQARLTYMNRMEEIRRLQGEAEQTVGYNRAAVGASNVQFSGSAQRHIDSVRQGFAQDIAWRRAAANMERKAIRAGAPGGAANFATIAQGIGNIGGSLLNYHSATK